ncbi:MAG: hypothetical protein Q8P68_03440 [Candidatus Peregrinibacteria bacterium]|nr:hypothetical protein [Candidatus Peregrinibacteria bacterium]
MPNLERDLILFFAFALSLTTIFLLLILPKFIFNYYPLSLAFLVLGFIISLVYTVRHVELLKINSPILKEKIIDYRLLLLAWIGVIVLMVIPAIHYPWYFGYGVDWVNHLEVIREYIIKSGDIFYPAINVHAFLSILNLLHFPYPEVFQIGSAYLLSLSVFPLYFIAKLLLPYSKAVNISLLLWLILPYNHLLYGEFIPNGASVFFFLTFFLVILMILKRRIIEKNEHVGFLTVLGGLFLAGAVYNHQVFLYPFFYIYLFITIFYFLVFGKVKYVTIAYAKILGLAILILLPFLGKLYTGSQEVLKIHNGKESSYILWDVLSMIHNSMGLATLLLAFLGTCLYCFQNAVKKSPEGKFNTIVVFSLFAGNLLAVNVYFGGNPFWSERSLYLFEIFAIPPITYLIYVWMIRWPSQIRHVCVFVLFIFILGTRIEYSISIDPLWSKELQSSIEWAKVNKAFVEDKSIYLVFGDPSISSVNHVFELAFQHHTDLSVLLIGKDEYINNIKMKQNKVLLDNNFYTISMEGNNLYFDYKVEAIKSGDALSFNDYLISKPKLIYTLDSMLRRYFLDRRVDNYSL